MAKEIVFDYKMINNLVVKLQGTYTDNFKTAGETLINNLNNAFSGADGKSVKKFLSLVDESIKKYVVQEIPNAIKEIGNVLNQNAKAMKDADEEISKALPDSNK